MKFVFCVSGPDRAIEDTLQSISNLKGIKAHATVVHIWEHKDLTKERASEIRNLPGVSNLCISSQPEATGFMNRPDDLTSSDLPANSLSMFWGIHECTQVAIKLFPEATHLVRVRTDLKLKPQIGRYFASGDLVVGKSADIPLSWTSDQLMAGPKEIMRSIWGQTSIEQLLSELKYQKNPELLVTKRLQNLGKNVRIIKARRFIDYEIIRTAGGDIPPKSIIIQFKLSKVMEENTFARALLLFSSLARSVVHELAYRVGRIP